MHDTPRFIYHKVNYPTPHKILKPKNSAIVIGIYMAITHFTFFERISFSLYIFSICDTDYQVVVTSIMPNTATDTNVNVGCYIVGRGR